MGAHLRSGSEERRRRKNHFSIEVWECNFVAYVNEERQHTNHFSIIYTLEQIISLVVGMFAPRLGLSMIVSLCLFKYQSELMWYL
ncbi:hypothetical protein HanRHA438_Chr12g0563861 [Helianthus annuus]|nr:hypothetical protein HanIR_Chr12g0596361 [Helianthus annuus]KAJ0867494.1 hypothetical protein HanRHA438_Chr12g0563861 [Helianthus annuus]